MKLDMRTAILLAVGVAMVPVSVFAQLFSQPSALMYRPVSGLESPPPHTKLIRVARYIPGARFPDSWDQRIEERHYDPAGKLTRLVRYDGYTGNLIYEKNVTYTPQGDRLEERSKGKELPAEEVLKFQNQYDAKGVFTGANILDGKGASIGSIQVLPNGNRVTIFAQGGTGASLTVEHDARGRMVRSVNNLIMAEDRYVYDAQGDLAEIIRVRNGKESKVTYKNTRNASGQITMQEEIGPEGRRVMYFDYDKNGRCVAKKLDPTRPLEGYGYSPLGDLTDLMQYTPDGFPKEVNAYFIERY